MIFDNERIYSDGVVPITYVLETPKNVVSNKLMIIFSAFSASKKPEYNYYRTVQNVNINKLFILDNYGERGSYYLGHFLEGKVEQSIIALVESILKEHGIEKDNVLCLGSSKGGWAALYYGIKYGYGYVFVGEPQIQVAKYLRDAKALDVLDYIVDSDQSQANKLDLLLYKTVNEVRKFPHVLIHAGSGSYHFKAHILPFVNYCYSRGFCINLDIRDYKEHNSLVNYFPNLCTERLLAAFPELKRDSYILSVNVTNEHNIYLINTNAINCDYYAWYVMKNGKRVWFENYRENNFFKYKIEMPGTYYFVAFAKKKNQKPAIIQTRKITVKEI